MLKRRIEEAALNSWPALQYLLFDGWIVRFSQGYTKRANSVTPLYPSLLPDEEKIAYCERLYMEKLLLPIFRLPSFFPECLQLDQLLAQRGYRTLDHTLVYYTSLLSNQPTAPSTVQYIPLSSWFPIYRQFSTRYSDLQHLHSQLLQRIPSPHIYAALYEQGIPVACGLGVLEDTFFGIFDIVTDPNQLRKGYATQLVTTMLAWAYQHNAQYAYLQVVDTNHAARQLYTKLGFQEYYYYWYRVQS